MTNRGSGIARIQAITVGNPSLTECASVEG